MISRVVEVRGVDGEKVGSSLIRKRFGLDAIETELSGFKRFGVNEVFPDNSLICLRASGPIFLQSS